MVNHFRYGIDQLDGKLRDPVTGRRFRAKDKGTGYHIPLRMILQLVIQIHYMQDIQ